MKRILFLTFAFSVFNNELYSQFEGNTWEVGVLANGGLVTNSTYYSDDHAFFNLNLLPAYFITKGFSIEPQIGIGITEGAQPEFNFIGNLAYTFRIKNSGFAPYMKAGYGISNSVSLINNALDAPTNEYHSDEFDIGVFNSGLGMKFLINKKTALRAEANYKLYFAKNPKFNYPGNEGPKDTDISNLSFLGGVSFLF